MTANPLEKQTYTVDDLIAMPDDADGKRYELIDGEIVEIGTSNQKHSTLGACLIFKLLLHIETNKLGGRVGSADATYKLDEKNTRVPDVSYLTPASVAKLSPGTVFCPFAPDFAIEIQSPSNSDPQMRKLARLYIKTGTRLVWIIDPYEQVAKVYRPGQPATEFAEDEVIDGGDILPGLQISLAELWAKVADA